MATTSINYTSGKTVYVEVLNALQIFNAVSNAWEYYTAADFADYAIPCVESPAGTYTATLPAALTNPPYIYYFYAQAGATPAVTDQMVSAAGISGQYTVTVTVENSNSQPITDASVTILCPSATYGGLTNSNGIAIFALPSGNYTLAATAPGFSSPAPVNLTVSSTTAQTVVLSANSGVVILAPSVCSCFGSAYLPSGQSESGMQVTFNLIGNPTSMQSGQIFDSSPITATTNSAGELSTSSGNFVSLYQTATYSISIGNTVVVSSYTVPAASSATLPALVGTP